MIATNNKNTDDVLFGTLYPTTARPLALADGHEPSWQFDPIYPDRRHRNTGRGGPSATDRTASPATDLLTWDVLELARSELLSERARRETAPWQC